VQNGESPRSGTLAHYQRIVTAGIVDVVVLGQQRYSLSSFFCMMLHIVALGNAQASHKTRLFIVRLWKTKCIGLHNASSLRAPDY
jgi:hypothetical protein